MDIGKPVVDRQVQSLQNLVDNAVVRREHHAPAQSHSDGRQQIRQEQQGAHGFLAPFQTVDKQRHHKTDEHLKNHSKNSELDGVENGLLEIRVAQQLCIVLKGDKMGPFLQAAEKVVVGKAVNQRKEQRIRRHDQQDHNGRGQHSQTKPFGLGICGAEFGIYVSFHDSGLTFQKRYGS